MSIKQIVSGHIKEILNQNEEMSKKRLSICAKCPIYNHINNVVGGLCSSSLYFNPITDEVSDKRREGMVRGCGCRLDAKTRLVDAKCPAGKW